MGKEWGALGAIPWPEDLLELRVLAKQLRVSLLGVRHRVSLQADEASMPLTFRRSGAVERQLGISFSDRDGQLSKARASITLIS